MAVSILIAVFIAAILFYFIAGLYFEMRTGVPTLVSFAPARKQMLEILRAESRERGGAAFNIVDLGSGNGQLARAIALMLPNAHVTGIEISFLPWLISCARRRLLGPKNLAYRHADFWSFDIAGANAVVLFINGRIVDRMSKKLRDELKPGVPVISNEVRLTGDWQPVATFPVRLFGRFPVDIYLYRQG